MDTALPVQEETKCVDKYSFLKSDKLKHVVSLGAYHDTLCALLSFFTASFSDLNSKQKVNVLQNCRFIGLYDASFRLLYEWDAKDACTFEKNNLDDYALLVDQYNINLPQFGAGMQIHFNTKQETQVCLPQLLEPFYTRHGGELSVYGLPTFENRKLVLPVEVDDESGITIFFMDSVSTTRVPAAYVVLDRKYILLY